MPSLKDRPLQRRERWWIVQRHNPQSHVIRSSGLPSIAPNTFENTSCTSYATKLLRKRGAAVFHGVAVAQQIVVARSSRTFGRQFGTAQLPAAYPLQKNAPPPGEAFSCRSIFPDWKTGGTRKKTHSASHQSDSHTDRCYPSPLSFLFTCPAPPVSTRDALATALQRARGQKPVLLKALLSDCGRFNHLPDQGRHR